MSAYPLLRTRMVVGAMLLALAAGCDVQHAQSYPGLGASSGGGAAVFPASPVVGTPPAASAPTLVALREQSPATGPAAAAREVRSSPTITASGNDVMQLAMPPKHGTVAISGFGPAAQSIRYTPTPGYLGDDQFSLSLAGGRQTVTVSISAR